MGIVRSCCYGENDYRNELIMDKSKSRNNQMKDKGHVLYQQNNFYNITNQNSRSKKKVTSTEINVKLKKAYIEEGYKGTFDSNQNFFSSIKSNSRNKSQYKDDDVLYSNTKKSSNQGTLGNDKINNSFLNKKPDNLLSDIKTISYK